VVARGDSLLIRLSGDFGLGQGHFLNTTFLSAFGGLFGKLQGHGFDSALELQHEGLALGQGLAKLAEFVLGFLQLGGEIVFEFFRVHMGQCTCTYLF
jgi:hypothetical protein